MFKKLIPRETGFFDRFDRMCGNIVEGALIFKQLVKDGKTQVKDHASRLKDVEHRNDELVHDTLSQLHKTFITPIDREYIRKLAVKLDDILDLTDIAASSIVLYKPKKVPLELGMLAQVLVGSAETIREMVGLIRNLNTNSSRIMELTIEIKGLENEADMLRRTIMARLFEKEKNAIELIKWKDIISSVENATDMCEDVSDLVEAVVLENL